MPLKLVWTEPRDLCLRRLRAEGSGWDVIAAALGISRNAASERGRRLGARLPPRDHVPRPEDPDRPPLRAGDPRSWGALVAGTLLEGAAFPEPDALVGPLRRAPDPPRPATAEPVKPMAAPVGPGTVRRPGFDAGMRAASGAHAAPPTLMPSTEWTPDAGRPA